MANKDTQKNSAEAYRDERKARLAQSAKKSQKKSEKNSAAVKVAKKVIAIILAVAIVCGAVWAAVAQSGVIEKNNTLISLGDVKISELEYIYYYSRQLSNIYYYADYYAQYGMDIGISSSKSPDEQTYGQDEDGKDIILSDYIKDATVSALQEYKILYLEALKADYKLTDDEQKDIDEQIEETRKTAAENNYSLNAYLKASMGKGVNEKFIREQMKMEKIVTRYQSDTNKKFVNSYTEDVIKSVYEKDKSKYDVVDMRAYSFDVETLTKKDGESDADLAKRQSAANDKLKAQAEAMVKAATSETAFLEEAKRLNKSTEDYDADSATDMAEASREDVVSSVNEEAAKWAFDGARKAGDVKMFVIGEEDAVVSYGVLMMTKTQYAPLAVDVRHILASFSEDNSTSDPTDAQKAAAKKSAEEIYKSWQDGAKTEDSFAALAKEKSADTGSAEDGGMISGITSGSNYVKSFLDWCFAKDRKVGDNGIIESEYGYHIMYCSAIDYSWKSTIRSEKASEDFTAQMESLKESDTYKMKKNEKKLDKAVAKYIKDYKEKLAMSQSSK